MSSILAKLSGLATAAFTRPHVRTNYISVVSFFVDVDDTGSNRGLRHEWKLMPSEERNGDTGIVPCKYLAVMHEKPLYKACGSARCKGYAGNKLSRGNGKLRAFGKGRRLTQDWQRSGMSSAALINATPVRGLHLPLQECEN